MPAIKLTVYKDRVTAKEQAHKLAKKEKGVYIIISRSQGKRVYLAKIPNDVTFVGVIDGRTDRAKTILMKAN